MDAAVVALKVQTSAKRRFKDLGNNGFHTFLKFLTGRKAFGHGDIIVTSYFFRAWWKPRW
jgi:hypothetical protein